MKIIDAHLHFVPENPYFQEIAVRAEHKNTEEDLRAVYQKYNIEGGVVMGNRGVDPVDHSYPEFLRYCVGIDGDFLVSEDKKKSLDQVEENLKRDTCVGIKLYPGYNKMYVTDEVYEPLYDLAKAYKKPVAIHMGQTAGSRAYLKYSHPLTLDEAAVRHPDVNFVMCHFGSPFLESAAAVVEIRLRRTQPPTAPPRRRRTTRAAPTVPGQRRKWLRTPAVRRRTVPPTVWRTPR